MRWIDIDNYFKLLYVCPSTYAFSCFLACVCDYSTLIESLLVPFLNCSKIDRLCDRDLLNRVYCNEINSSICTSTITFLIKFALQKSVSIEASCFCNIRSAAIYPNSCMLYGAHGILKAALLLHLDLLHLFSLSLSLLSLSLSLSHFLSFSCCGLSRSRPRHGQRRRRPSRSPPSSARRRTRTPEGHRAPRAHCRPDRDRATSEGWGGVSVEEGVSECSALQRGLSY